MKLSNLFNEVLGERNTWQKLSDILNDTSTLTEGVSSKMSLFLEEAKKTIFQKFNINPKDKVYFIAGSARLYLYPELVTEMNQLDPNFPTSIGDLDVVIPNVQIWQNAGMSEYLKTGIYRPYELDPPLTNLNVEAFTVWDPKRAGGAYANVEVRSESELFSDLEFIDGFWFMGLQDVLDYKNQMVRKKEIAVSNLIKQYEEGDVTPEKRHDFLRKVAMIITGNYKM